MENKTPYFLIFANYSLPGHLEKHIAYLRAPSQNESNYALEVGTDNPDADSDVAKEIMADIEKDVQNYQKRHSFFIGILDQIIAGKDFSDIDDFVAVFLNAEGFTHQSRFTIEKDKEGRKIISSRTSFDFIPFSTPGIFLYSLACHSLLTFLSPNNRGRIKRCPVCQRLFAAKHMSRKLCSADCQRTNKNNFQKNFMQGKRDKDSDKFDARYV
ncbi:MAG TPA: hypothetical protein PK983_03810 [Syntrophales bacterium]|nr:hypothetical protein [Syntrophales bacterium]